MTYNCHGICELRKTNKLPTAKKYESGQKRCSICRVFLETSDIRCPCCNAILRIKSRKNKQDLFCQ